MKDEEDYSFLRCNYGRGENNMFKVKYLLLMKILLII